MKQNTTNAIILSRTNFQEADRILTILSSDSGKLQLIAKGARKQKSKLAGGLELLSISQISYIIGKTEIYTVTSTRLVEHFGKIVCDVDRTFLAYELIKQVNKITDQHHGKEYFPILKSGLKALNEGYEINLISCWFIMQIMTISGYKLNLEVDNEGDQLKQEKLYNFDFDDMVFIGSQRGKYGANQIKTLRLLRDIPDISVLSKVKGIDHNIKILNELINVIRSNTLH